MMLWFSHQLQLFLWAFLNTVTAFMTLLNVSTKKVVPMLQSYLLGH